MDQKEWTCHLSGRVLKSSFERTCMSTSLLYHAFGIRGYHQTRTEFSGGVVRFHVQPNGKSVCCSSCRSDNVIRRGAKEREFRASPIGTKSTVIVAKLPRVECRDCGVVRQIQVGFAEPRRSFTKGWAKLQPTCRSKMCQALCDLRLNCGTVERQCEPAYRKGRFILAFTYRFFGRAKIKRPRWPFDFSSKQRRIS